MSLIYSALFTCNFVRQERFPFESFFARRERERDTLLTFSKFVSESSSQLNSIYLLLLSEWDGLSWRRWRRNLFSKWEVFWTSCGDSRRWSFRWYIRECCETANSVRETLLFHTLIFTTSFFLFIQITQQVISNLACKNHSRTSSQRSPLASPLTLSRASLVIVITGTSQWTNLLPHRYSRDSWERMSRDKISVNVFLGNRVTSEAFLSNNTIEHLEPRVMTNSSTFLTKNHRWESVRQEFCSNYTL